MLHNGATIMLPMGYYEVDDPMITTERRSDWDVNLDVIALAILFQEKLQSEDWPFSEKDMARYAEIKAIPADRPRRKLVRAAYDLVGLGTKAGEFISTYVHSRGEGLVFQKTDHGYLAIVPDHDCVGADDVCPADDDPKSTYGLSDEELAELQQNGA